ncbi:MAG: M24 family metallopeptidase [Acidobacteriota bacterium]|nr:M24 family metallopeptidase [Acidobacteriota bacterium]
MIADDIEAVQQALADAELDGWLFCVFQQNDPVSLELLGLIGEHLVTRRCYYLVPAHGEPRKLVHRLEPAMLDALPGSTSAYLTWREHRAQFHELVSSCNTLACQYSPDNQLPTVSRLDAGTADLLRACGVELASSAELIQQFAAVWDDDQLASHQRASTALHEIVLAAFDRVADTLRTGASINEYQIQSFILESFERRGLHSEGHPIVGVNEHSADPHFATQAEGSSPIQQGDFLLIDLWAKELHPRSIYGDITWCAVCAASPAERHQEIFDIVARARDAAFQLVDSRYPSHDIRGYEVDNAARGIIESEGYGASYIHRTGHSIGISDHGQGANMDDLETHDERRLRAMTGFSIEPGIYLPGEFGVRSEIDVVLLADRAEISGGEAQQRLLTLLA